MKSVLMFLLNLLVCVTMVAGLGVPGACAGQKRMAAGEGWVDMFESLFYHFHMGQLVEVEKEIALLEKQRNPDPQKYAFLIWCRETLYKKTSAGGSQPMFTPVGESQREIAPDKSREYLPPPTLQTTAPPQQNQQGNQPPPR